jgi:hypothetical protein
MDALRTIATLLPLAVSSGLNLYATVLVAGLCIRFGWVQNTPAGLDVLASWPVIVVAGICYTMEFLADKIQFVDNLWDVVHTVIRPLGAALIGMAALGKADPLVMVLGALAMGSIALVSHAGKAGTRVALNVVSPAENVSNIGVSLGEDVAAGVLTVAALRYPLVAGVAGVAILVALVLVVPRLLAWAWFVLGGAAAWLAGGARRAIGRPPVPDRLPPMQALLLGHQTPLLSVRGKAQNIHRVGGRTGYLSLLADNLAFTYDTLTGQELWSLPLDRMLSAQLRRRALLDVVEVRYLDEQRRTQTARFAFLKDRSGPAEQLAADLAGRLSSVSGPPPANKLMPRGPAGGQPASVRLPGP